MDDERSGELVTIKRFPDVASAVMARVTLQAAGIDAFLPEENLASLNWEFSLALGGISLQVDRSAAEEALAVLAARQEDGDLPSDNCPRCGSRDVALRNRVTSSAALMLMLPFSLPAVLSLSSAQMKAAVLPWRSPHVYRCRRCTNEWSLPPDPTALQATESEVPDAPDEDRPEPINPFWWWYAAMAVAAAWILHKYASG